VWAIDCVGHVFAPAVSENTPTTFPCCPERATDEPLDPTGVIGRFLAGDALEADDGRSDRVGNAVRVTSAALAAASGWPLALTTQTATLCWCGGRRAISTTMRSSFCPLADGADTPGLQSPPCTTALLLLNFCPQKQHSRTKPNLSNTSATRSRSGVSLLLPFHVKRA
jgi:hypothetical protein